MSPRPKSRRLLYRKSPHESFYEVMLTGTKEHVGRIYFDDIEWYVHVFGSKGRLSGSTVRACRTSSWWSRAQAAFLDAYRKHVGVES